MRRTYYNSTSFLDLLFNFACLALAFFIIAALQIRPDEKEADIKTKAEFIITVTWDDKHDNDVDTWIQDPNGEKLFYKAKEVGIMHLDRDDRGWSGDTYEEGGVKHIIYRNQEIATIRGFIEGEWTINIHMYRFPGPSSTVKVLMQKLNPQASIVFEKEFKMNHYWEEITVARIEMTQKGEILSVDHELPNPMIIDEIGVGSYSNNNIGGIGGYEE
jgi:hypothetical protein